MKKHKLGLNDVAFWMAMCEENKQNFHFEYRGCADYRQKDFERQSKDLHENKFTYLRPESLNEHRNRLTSAEDLNDIVINNYISLLNKRTLYKHNTVSTFILNTFTFTKAMHNWYTRAEFQRVFNKHKEFNAASVLLLPCNSIS